MITLAHRGKRSMNGVDLGMAASDFRCSTIGRLWICVPANTRAMSVIKDLQQLIRNISTQMAAVGRLDVPTNLATLDVDGRVGPTTALGAQFIAAAFASVAPPPPSVRAILDQGISGAEVINRVALASDEIVLYFSSTLTNFPKAITADPIVIIKAPPRMVPSAQAAVAGLGALSVFAGILGAAAKAWA